MSAVKEDKKTGGCNCKKAEEYKQTVDFLKMYGGFEDTSDSDGKVPLRYKLSSVLMTFLCVILVPFLFIHIVVSALYHKIRYGKAYVDNSLIFRIMKNHNE